MSQILNLGSVCRYAAQNTVQSLFHFSFPSDINALNPFVLKPIKVAVELFSLITTNRPEIAFLSALSKEAKTTIDATFGTFDLLNTAISLPKALWNRNLKFLLTDVPFSLLPLADIQDVFNKCVPEAPMRAPLSLFSKLLQWKIPSPLLLSASLASGALGILENYRNIENWTHTVKTVKNSSVDSAASHDIACVMKIAANVTLMAYSLIKAFSGSSRTSGWAKACLLAASTGFDIMALVNTPSREARATCLLAASTGFDIMALVNTPSREARAKGLRKWIDENKGELGFAFSCAVQQAANATLDESLQTTEEERAAFAKFEKSQNPYWNQLKSLVDKERKSPLNMEMRDKRNISEMTEHLIDLMV